MKLAIKNKGIISRWQRKFRTQKHNVFTEDVNKIAMRADDNKRIQSTNSIETFVCGTSKDIIHKNEETKCNNMIK